MAPLYHYNGKLLSVGGQVVNSDHCCCDVPYPPPVYKWYCDPLVQTCRKCCYSGTCLPADTPCSEVSADLYNERADCVFYCCEYGACCSGPIYTPCRPTTYPGKCYPVDEAWAIVGGYCQRVTPPAGATWYTNGCDVWRWTSSNSGDPCHNSQASYVVGQRTQTACANTLITANPPCFNHVSKSWCDSINGTYYPCDSCAAARPCYGNCEGGSVSRCQGDGPEPTEQCVFNGILCNRDPVITVTVRNVKPPRTWNGTEWVFAPTNAGIQACNDTFIMYCNDTNVTFVVGANPSYRVTLNVSISGLASPQRLCFFVRQSLTQTYTGVPPSISAGKSSYSNLPSCTATKLEYISTCDCREWHRCTLAAANQLFVQDSAASDLVAYWGEASFAISIG